MSEALVFDQIIDLFPVLSLPVGPVFISVGWKMILFLQFRISVLMIVWHIFGAMGTGFRHIIAKHFQKFIPDLIIMIVCPCQGLLPDFRVKILSVPGNFQKPCLVVDSADPVNDIIRRHSQPFQQFFCTDLHTVAEALTACRLAAAAEFSERVEQELAYLDMAGVRFSITRREKPYGPTGADEMEFMICTNTGEEAKPLAKIASGGELARIMLAIKDVLAEKDGIGTIIFDEVDTGVSGRAAQKIGKKLAEVARHRQVICVTHLAPVAACAAHHYRIYKTVEDGRTFTRVEELTRPQRVQELARIMVGENITDSALKSAEEMLES